MAELALTIELDGLELCCKDAEELAGTIKV
jgi:hypothetical protein